MDFKDLEWDGTGFLLLTSGSGFNTYVKRKFGKGLVIGEDVCLLFNEDKIEPQKVGEFMIELLNLFIQEKKKEVEKKEAVAGLTVKDLEEHGGD